MDSDLLADRFIHWCRACHSPQAEARQLWSDLSALYQESHRHYHTLTHIAASLAELDATGKGTPELEGAIWFHDVIYDPTRGDNEDASIEWFENATVPWLAPETRTAITRLIAATDFRRPRNDDPAEALMVDIDLAILSVEWPLYDAYRRSVRREYAHVPDEAFRAGRAKVMASFLAAPVYRTPHFTQRESRARENIAREIAELGSDRPIVT
jgi:predicted metal-dependent HD superfamily phosphohydrolase